MSRRCRCARRLSRASRTLFSMHENNYTPTAPTTNRRVTGDTMGNTTRTATGDLRRAVRLAQEFSMPAADRRAGNFGSVDGDPPAPNATPRSGWRARPCSCSRLENDTVDSSQLRRPRARAVVLPAKFPNLWSTAPAASPSHATNIPRTSRRGIDACMPISIIRPLHRGVVEIVPVPIPTGASFRRTGIRSAYTRAAARS